MVPAVCLSLCRFQCAFFFHNPHGRLTFWWPPTEKIDIFRLHLMVCLHVIVWTEWCTLNPVCGYKIGLSMLTMHNMPAFSNFKWKKRVIILFGIQSQPLTCGAHTRSLLRRVFHTLLTHPLHIHWWQTRRHARAHDIRKNAVWYIKINFSAVEMKEDATRKDR